MASYINPFAFLLFEDGTYIFYHNNKPVIDQVADPSVDVIENVDSHGVRWTTFVYHDDRIGEYMSKVADSLISQQQNVPVKIRMKTTRESSVTVNENQTQAQRTLKAQAQAGNQASEQSTNNANANHVFNNVQQAFGNNLPNREDIRNLVDNTSAYGNSMSLVYPSDLISNQYGYNGCYTVFYISEHQDSSIAKNQSLITDKKFVNSAQSSVQQDAATIDHQTYRDLLSDGLGAAVGIGTAKFATSIFGKALDKLASSTVGNKFGALSGQLASLGAAAAGGAVGYAVSNMAEDLQVLQNKASYKQLNIAIALPTPAIVDNHTLTWNEQSALMSGGALELAKASGKFSSDQTNEMQQASNSTQKRGESLQAVGYGAVDAFLINQVGKAGEHWGSGLSRIAGKAANARKEQIFQNVEMRNFDMNFQLAARSAKDMENIESIIRVLKYHAYPELTAGDFLWIYPAQFDIVHYFRNGVNTHMPRHATSVLKNIQVDYAGGQNFISVHHDGSPVIINLKLTFQEIAVLSREDIAKGY